jgi:hypothetical protein
LVNVSSKKLFSTNIPISALTNTLRELNNTLAIDKRMVCLSIHVIIDGERW